MSRASQRLGLKPRDFRRIHMEWEPRIRLAAEWVAKGDRDLADDLAQVGRIMLWRMSPRDPALREPKLLVRVLVRRMMNHTRSADGRRLVE